MLWAVAGLEGLLLGIGLQLLFDRRGGRKMIGWVG